MTQPKFTPIPIEDEVRPTYKLAPPRPWTAHRPGELLPRPRVHRRGFGTPGPDQGYALKLAEAIGDRAVLVPGERRVDAVASAVAIALARAAAFGRAPVGGDIEFGLAYLGYLEHTPEEIGQLRRRLVSGAAHDDWRQRRLVETLPADVLVTPKSDLTARIDWHALEDE